jgi:hypothetical protein
MKESPIMIHQEFGKIIKPWKSFNCAPIRVILKQLGEVFKAELEKET